MLTFCISFCTSSRVMMHLYMHVQTSDTIHTPASVFTLYYSLTGGNIAMHQQKARKDVQRCFLQENPTENLQGEMGRTINCKLQTPY